VRLVAASLPLAVVLLDVTAVAVLAPDIRLDLGSSSSGGIWVLNAYLLALAAPLPMLTRIPVPALALVAAGGLVTAAGAAVGASADSTAVLVTGRAVQGAGAAALLACTAASLGTEARRGALALALPALALAVGPLVGGVFAEQNWWRVFFWAGVPLALVCAGASLLPPHRERPPRSPASIRTLAFAGGLTAVTIAAVQSEVWSWGWVALVFLAGAALLGVARVWEASGAALAWAAAAGCLAALVFLMPEYFQLARNLSGLRSGALLLAVTVPAVTAWAISRSSASRVRPTALALTGLAGACLGLAVLTAIDADSRYTLVIGALCVAGGGLGLIGAWSPGPLVPTFAGAALGLAGAGGAFQLAQADERDAGGSFEQALAAGVGWAALFLCVLLLAGALVIWRRPRPASSAARRAAAS
jgi:MFS family permease